MQNTKTTESPLALPFLTKLEDWVGGICIETTDLTQTSLLAGTPVGRDTNELWHVIKQAVMEDTASDSATDYKVDKGHNFKVGDVITTGLSAAAYAITAITTTETDYDTISVGTTLGVALVADDILFQAYGESASDSTWKYTPLGLI